jgi:uncharacterized membrane protein HdeD (DUF308 family)
VSTSTAAGRPARPSTIPELNDISVTLARNWWLIGLRGVVAILFGVVALAVPVATILALLLLFAAYMIVDAVFSFVAAFRAMRRGGRWGLLILQGLASLAAGVIAVIWPGITVVAFVLLIGAWTIVTGCLLLAAAFRTDTTQGRLWFGLTGAVSLLYGILMILSPLIGALVLAWWLGAFAIVFGVLLVIMAFRLRSQQRSERPEGLRAQPVT